MMLKTTANLLTTKYTKNGSLIAKTALPAFHPMSLISALFGAVFMVAIATSVSAGVNIYEFEDDEQTDQFYGLIEELRCPKCQNQNLADSDAPLAKDIKKRVYKLVKEGKSDKEITAYLVERFGDFVTYRPPIKPGTWLLWFGPGIVLVIVAVILFVRVRNAQDTELITEVDAAEVEQLLKTYSENDSSEQEKKPE